MIKHKNSIQMKNCMYNIKWLRRHYRLSRGVMAYILKTSVLNIILIELGKVPSTLSLEVVFIIKDFFGIEPKEMFKERFKE